MTGLALFCASSLAFGFAEEIAVLDAARFTQGLGSAASWTAALAWLARESAPERRGARLGTAFSAAVGGALLGPALGAAARGLAPEAVFSIAAAVGLAMIVWCLRLGAPPASRDEAGWTVALRERALLPGAGVILLVGLLFGVVQVLLPLRFDDLGASGLVIGAGVRRARRCSDAVAGPLIGRLSDRIGPLRPVRVSLVAGIALALLFPVPEAIPVLFVLCCVMGPVDGGLFVPGMKMLADGAESARLDQGYAFAIFNFTWALTTAAGAAGGGALADAAGDAVAYAALAAVLAVGLIASLRASARFLASLLPRRALLPALLPASSTSASSASPRRR